VTDAAALPSDAPSSAALPALQERGLLAGLVFVCAIGGYYLIGLTEDPSRATTLHTALDDAIPLEPKAMWFYAWVYTAMLYPVFAIRDRLLFRRSVAAYLSMLAVCFATYVLYPVTSADLRADPASLDLGLFWDWGLRLNYHLDPPVNLFPSLHMAAVVLAALCAGKARPLYGWIAAPLVCLIAWAICAVKQHYAVDGVAGAALGAACYLAWVHRAQPEDPEARAFTWRGPATYAAFHCSIYVGLYALFKAQFRPWE
jgi:membrane-associated phospholipid phosphatase